MRRIDVILLGLGLLLGGPLLYSLLQTTGLDAINAGLWSQGLLVGGILLWVSTYFFRVATKNMTYSQQLRDYEETMMQRQLENLSPEEVEKLVAEVEAERVKRSAPTSTQ